MNTVTISNTEIKVSGCNQIWGGYSYDPSSQEFSAKDFASTRMGCPPDT